MHQQPHDAPHKTQSPAPDVPKQPPDSNKGTGTGGAVVVCARVHARAAEGAMGGAPRR